ncbi:MAG TPA: VTC domain-containing protein [Bacteroidales bacterium]|nr:VTC domain-containing protein [Bacteroidales bacterium]
MTSENLLPVVTNYFTRITLVSIEDKTRITLDYGLSFKGTCGAGENLPYLAIAEIKQEGNNNNNFFVKLLKKRGVRQGGFSKYCIGSALLYNDLRKNSLKPNFLLLNRIKKQYDIDTLADN